MPPRFQPPERQERRNKSLPEYPVNPNLYFYAGQMTAYQNASRAID